MSLKLSTLNNAVDKAFEALGEKVVTCSFTHEAVTGFDFSNGTVQSSSTSEDVDGVLIKATVKPGVAPSETDYVIIKSGSINNLSLYSEVTISGARYRISDYEDNQFTVRVNLLKDR